MTYALTKEINLVSLDSCQTKVWTPPFLYSNHLPPYHNLITAGLFGRV